MTVSNQKVASVIILVLGGFLFLQQLEIIRDLWYYGWGPGNFVNYIVLGAIYSLLLIGAFGLYTENRWGAILALIGGIILATVNGITLVGSTITYMPSHNIIEILKEILYNAIYYTIIPVIIIIGATVGRRTD